MIYFAVVCFLLLSFLTSLHWLVLVSIHSICKQWWTVCCLCLLCIQCITLCVFDLFLMYICNLSESRCAAGTHTPPSRLTCVCVFSTAGVCVRCMFTIPVKMEMSFSADVLVLTDFCPLQPGNSLSLDWIRAIFFQISHLLPDSNTVDLMCSCRNQPVKVIRDKESKSRVWRKRAGSVFRRMAQCGVTLEPALPHMAALNQLLLVQVKGYRGQLWRVISWCSYRPDHPDWFLLLNQLQRK